MPLIEVCVVENELSPEQKVEIANEMSASLMKAIPRLSKESISVIFYESPGEDWIVGGVTVKELIERAKKAE